jgi:YidC/Oxa1 family membrane protein insertase
MQWLFDGLGWVLAELYDRIPSYAAAIVLLTIGIRLLLLPLGIKQIRSMQAMAALQPKVKVIQQKHRGNRAKQQEELQKLYQQAGVNPLSGCLPMLLQLPVLIALFSVISLSAQALTHLPQGSDLKEDIIAQQGVHFAGMNLLCAASQAGSEPDIEAVDVNAQGQKVTEPIKLECGKGIPIRIPYYVLALLMIATTYYQQRQMQRANPAGTQQQQTLMRILPLLFGIWGFLFPTGLVLYWTTSNLWQIGQQHFMLRAKAKQEALTDSSDGKRKGPPVEPPPRRGLFGSLTDRTQAQRDRRAQATTKGRQRPRPGTLRAPAGTRSPGGEQRPGQTPPGTRSTQSGSGTQGGQSSQRGGGKSGGSRKKRRKR